MNLRSAGTQKLELSRVGKAGTAFAISMRKSFKEPYMLTIQPLWKVCFVQAALFIVISMTLDLIFACETDAPKSYLLSGLIFGTLIYGYKRYQARKITPKPETK